MKDLPYLIIPAVAGTTILSMLIVPLYWHPKSATVERPATVVAERLRWPEEPLLPPSTAKSASLNGEGDNFISPPTHSIKTQRYIKIAITPEAKPPEDTDVCKRDGGYKITVHHGRGWRCRYPSHHSSATRSRRRR